MKKNSIGLLMLAVVVIGSSSAHSEPAADSTNTLRDPFWPVGFTPTPKGALDVSQAESRIIEQTRWPKLDLRGITRTANGDYIAILDGIGLVEPGDTISKRQDNLIYRWRINKITAQGVSRTRLDVREPTTTLQK
jgi:hypothetical protein